MKKLLIALPIIILIGCTTTGQAYLPHTSRIFHAKRSCAGCNDPNPIVFQSIQQAANSSGIAPCSVCITAKDFAVKNQGYTSTNFSTMPSNIQASSSLSNPPASSTGHKVLKFIANSTAKGIQTNIDKAPARRAARQQRLHQIEMENQLQRQTSIMQQQLDMQRQREFQQRQQRLLNPPPMQFQRRSYPALSNPSIPPVYKQQWQPMESPFKGSGLLDEKYSNPPATGSGILGN